MLFTDNAKQLKLPKQPIAAMRHFHSGRSLHIGTMESIRTQRHKRLIELLVAERKKKRVRQAELAKRLGTTQTSVTRMETGVRRIDVVELLALAEAIGFNASKILDQVAKVEPH
jgi:DNA-binding XRE family transcriptional regulator